MAVIIPSFDPCGFIAHRDFIYHCGFIAHFGFIDHCGLIGHCVFTTKNASKSCRQTHNSLSLITRKPVSGFATS